MRSWKLLSILAFAGLGQAASLAPVKLQNTGSAALSNVPVTFAQVFRAGDFKTGETLDADGLPTQVDLKAKHPDGSVRHAVITVMVDNLGANQEKTYALKTIPAKPGAGGALALESLLATAFDAKVSITLNGAVYEASAKQLLSQGKPKAWLSGPLCTEWLVASPVKTAAGAAHPFLTARFAIRAYTGLAKVRADVTVENAWAYEPNPQGFAYDVAVTVGGAKVFSQTGLEHTHHARWRTVAWWGGEPPIQIRQDRDYLLATGSVPRYDTRVKISESSLASWKTSFPPMDHGNLTPDMGDGGAQAQIGPAPQWTAQFLITADPRARASTLANGNCAGTYPIHFRDKKTDLPLSIDDYPYASQLGEPGDTRNPKTNQEERFPTVTNPLEKYHADREHEPSAAYYPYLVTGDFFYLEELQFWADWKLVIANPIYRSMEKGLQKYVSTRGQAWGLRNIAQAAYITPDDHPLKTYFTDKLNNNIAWYNEQFPSQNQIGYHWTHYDYEPFGIAPWQDDFLTWSVGYIHDLGFTAIKPFLMWKGKFLVGRFTDPGFCWLHATAYKLQVGTADKKTVFKTLAEMYRETFPGPMVCTGLAMDGYPEVGTGYPANMQPGLAAVVNSGIDKADQAWAKYETRNPRQDFSEAAQFAVIPTGMAVNPVRPGSKPAHGSLHGGLWSPGTGMPFGYTLQEPGRVYLEIYDSQGKKRAAVDQGVKAPGRHVWTGIGAGHALPTGISVVLPRVLPVAD